MQIWFVGLFYVVLGDAKTTSAQDTVGASAIHRLGGLSSRARSNLQYEDNDEILHASQSADISPRKRRADDVEWSQLVGLQVQFWSLSEIWGVGDVCMKIE